MFDFSIRKMKRIDLPHVLEIENLSHSHPWTLGNFEDSMNCNYWCYVFLENKLSEEIIGYSIFMPGFEELHLLNITIKENFRRMGVAQSVMLSVEPIAIKKKLIKILLEVRMSNLGAINLYQLLGYRGIGHRKDYYPSKKSVDGASKESAIIMEKILINDR
ncbi:MAG: ribosomal protein S18-alanine N-acetyltransferase [Betaproteobacteria bacterium]|jgi:ribosomal-protein-alanine N-acetyltransferase